MQPKQGEDRRKWEEISKYHGGLPKHLIGYSQVRPFWGAFEKRGRGKLHLKPMAMLAGSWVHREDRGQYQKEEGMDIRSLLGRKIYNIPQVFQVSNAVATEIFINEVVHDMFHFALPPINSYKELLHKVFVDYCLQTANNTHTESTWDKFVLDAMTSPFFFLRTADTYPLPENEFQAKLIKTMRGWYNSPKREMKMLSLWGMENPTEKDVEERVKIMIESGCKQYEGDKLPVDWSVV